MKIAICGWPCVRPCAPPPVRDFFVTTAAMRWMISFGSAPVACIGNHVACEKTGIYRRRSKSAYPLKNKKMLAVLGGRFDPIHVGHILLAKRAAQKLPVCGVRIIPNGQPPHKVACVASWEDRLHMCKLAVSGLTGVQVGDDEPPGKTRYTLKTLQHLRARFSFSLALIVGADGFADFHLWRHWRDIFSLSAVIVADRQGAVGAPAAKTSGYCRHRRCRYPKTPLAVGKIYHWRTNLPELSASEVRAKLAVGKTLAEDILSPAVSQYIAQKGLYEKSG